MQTCEVHCAKCQSSQLHSMKQDSHLLLQLLRFIQKLCSIRSILAQHKCKYEQRKQEVDHLPIHQFFDSTKPLMPCFATVLFNRNQSRDHLGGPRSSDFFGGRTNVWISPLHSFREFSIFSPNAGWKMGADGAETSELVKKIMFYPTER